MSKVRPSQLDAGRIAGAQSLVLSLSKDLSERPLPCTPTDLSAVETKRNTSFIQQAATPYGSEIGGTIQVDSTNIAGPDYSAFIRSLYN